MLKNITKISRILALVIPFGIGFFLFRNWFTSKYIIGGDWPFFYSEFLREFSFFPPAWASYQANGLGGQFISYSLDTYLYSIVSIFVNYLNFPWEVIYKTFFFGIFIVLSVSSSRYFLRTISTRLSKYESLNFICSIIYLTNTYILMIVSGGQMGVALAYSLTPFVVGSFLRIFDKKTVGFKPSIIAGLILAAQLLFDPRFVYISFITIIFYLLLNINWRTFIPNLHFNILKLIFVIIIPTGMALLIHSFWLLPSLLSRSNTAYDLIKSKSSEGLFKFLSFAEFSQALSLLHPNWPENIFGKVYFMRPEFILMPIMAFITLFFLNRSKIQDRKEYKKILWFCLIALFGAFISKGANPPLGVFNIWLHSHVPGFVLFRDPTKFYLLTVLAYSILIPYIVLYLSVFIAGKFKHGKKLWFYFTGLLIVFYLFFLILQLPLNQLGGTFLRREVPSEYVALKNYLHEQPEFFRTLWVPRQQRFSYYSNLHPSVEAESLFQADNFEQVMEGFKKKEVQENLSRLGIRYVIVPDDVYGEIFIKDREYDNNQYLSNIDELNTVGWLKKTKEFDKIVVYEVPDFKDHFFSNSGLKLSYQMKTPAFYTVSFTTDKAVEIIFSENYSPYWKGKIGDNVLSSQKTKDNLNSFLINQTGDIHLDVYFDKEKYYIVGRIISVSVFVVSVMWLIKLRGKN